MYGRNPNLLARPLDHLANRGRPCMCENARAPFSGVNFSHVDTISGDFSHRIRPLANLRGERKAFSHIHGRPYLPSDQAVEQEVGIAAIHPDFRAAIAAVPDGIRWQDSFTASRALRLPV